MRRFAAFTNQYPWQWEPAEAEAFITHSPVAVSTVRNYQVTLRLFCGYARRGAWTFLTFELPASVLSDLTGISISIAERWSQWAKRDWAAYVGRRADDDREDIDSRKPAKQTR